MRWYFFKFSELRVEVTFRFFSYWRYCVNFLFLYFRYISKSLCTTVSTSFMSTTYTAITYHNKNISRYSAFYGSRIAVTSHRQFIQINPRSTTFWVSRIAVISHRQFIQFNPRSTTFWVSRIAVTAHRQFIQFHPRSTTFWVSRKAVTSHRQFIQFHPRSTTF